MSKLPPALVSPATRHAIREALVGDYVAKLAELFQDHGFPPGADPPETMSGGRAVVQRYFNGITWSDREQVSRLCPIIEYALSRPPTDHDLRALLTRDGFRVDDDPLTVTFGSFAINPDALASLTDPSAIEEGLRRIQATVTSDPRTTVAAAYSLVESTAKLVLSARAQTPPERGGVPALARAAQKALGLTEEDVAADPTTGHGVHNVLGGLVRVVQGLCEIRNRGSMAHGQADVPAWVGERHARLVAGAAKLWCEFLLDTLRDPAAPWQKAGSAPPPASTSSP